MCNVTVGASERLDRGFELVCEIPQLIVLYTSLVIEHISISHN